MGHVVTFRDLPYRDSAAGATRAPITTGEMKQMAAEVIRLAPGATLTESVPGGSDRYLFTLSGEAVLRGRGASHTMGEESFATIEEGTELTLENRGGGDATLISVLAPPPGHGRAHAGFRGGLAVAARATTPVHEQPEQKKRRIYFVGEGAARSERAHAMIVLYVPETVTPMHMHPDADSIFVMLSGRLRFTMNGEDVVVRRGQVTCFPAGDRHGLGGADADGVGFLEFHVPAAFTTVTG